MAQLHQVKFEGYKLDKETIAAKIPGKSRGFIEDTVEELFEDWEDNGLEITPFAQWMELPVEVMDQERVKVGNAVYEDAYLAGRLEGVSKAILYYEECSEALYAYYKELDDALDTYIMNYALIESLNEGFVYVIEEIAGLLPDYCKGYVDIPGVEGRWALSGNQDIMNSFLNESEGDAKTIELLGTALNKNQFSFMGIIFGKVPEGCNGPWREKISIRELTEEIMEASGH